MGKSFLIIVILLLPACSAFKVVRDESEHASSAVSDYAEVQVHTIEESTTIEDTYEVLKNGIRQDTYPSRKILAGLVFPELHDDYENSEINYHYDDRRVLESSIQPNEKPDPYVLEEERKFNKLYEARIAQLEREAKLQGTSGQRTSSGYCYKTLADATCYRHPIKGQEFRLMN